MITVKSVESLEERSQVKTKLFTLVGVGALLYGLRWWWVIKPARDRRTVEESWWEARNWLTGVSGDTRDELLINL